MVTNYCQIKVIYIYLNFTEMEKKTPSTMLFEQIHPEYRNYC